MRHKVLAFGLALVFASIAALGVIAQGDNGQADKTANNREELVQRRLAAQEEKREILSAQRQARIELNCEKAQVKIQDVASRLAEFRVNHAKVYNGWYEKVANLLIKLEATDGVDAAQLRSDLESLDTLMTENQAGFTDYETELTEMLDLDCAENPQLFHDALLTARDLRKIVIDGMKSVKDYIQITIKDELKAIKDQLKGDKDDSPSDDQDGEQ